MNKPEEGLAPARAKIPIERYSSDAHFRKEIEKLFRRTWLNICRADRIPEPGDYIVQDLYALDVSVIIVRGTDKRIRAFYNMCPHRGNRVAMDQCGNRRGFKCLFHGWTYDLNGACVAMPGEKFFPGVERSDARLVEIHSDVWGGFVHINLEENPEKTLVEYMVPQNGLDGYLEQTWYPNFHYQAEVNCNWKLMIDAQIEFYHFDALHEASLAGAASVRDHIPEVFPDGDGIIGHTEGYFSPETAKHPPTDVQMIAQEQGNAVYFNPLDEGKAKQPINAPNAIAMSGRDDWIADSYSLLPHIVLLIQNNNFVIQRAWPVSVNKTIWDLQGFSFEPQPPSNFGEFFNLRMVQYGQRDVLSEDLSTLEVTQRNLGAGPIRNFHFSEQEGVLRQLQERIESYLAKP
ncbi:MAG: Rieske 2Fe-2S domain-containing protein [Gammaproteobacteria bacterium]|nr:Rieske 2Fe-2S domain-containing protein [Gammaproteobacteria bacterium]